MRPYGEVHGYTRGPTGNNRRKVERQRARLALLELALEREEQRSDEAINAELEAPPPLPDNWPEIRARIWNKIQDGMKANTEKP